MASRMLWASRAASYLRISVFNRGFASVVKDFKYADSHEWVKVDGNSATVGITDHAQDHLGDVVYVELPEVGASVSQGESFGAVESVKASSDIYSPISGKVVEVNEELSTSPGLVSTYHHVFYNYYRLHIAAVRIWFLIELVFLDYSCCFFAFAKFNSLRKSHIELRNLCPFYSS
ncbi:glycine cleavage system H protein 2, mitochondrial isoform X1 [Cannabis sativa]|uniref:glycine cleavage system H protein 2, mitochondrial isoform X1 n=1 Tax=Cannabis sativa TaxID=3483 RepID=UPI0029CA7161|nr:glycine cleavage system H protein 2, mitochondrial isoform X1 [Cannabis sativa]